MGSTSLPCPAERNTMGGSQAAGCESVALNLSLYRLRTRFIGQASGNVSRGSVSWSGSIQVNSEGTSQPTGNLCRCWHSTRIGTIRIDHRHAVNRFALSPRDSFPPLVAATGASNAARRDSRKSIRTQRSLPAIPLLIAQIAFNVNNSCAGDWKPLTSSLGDALRSWSRQVHLQRLKDL